jgi:hypothetical protein
LRYDRYGFSLRVRYCIIYRGIFFSRIPTYWKVCPPPPRKKYGRNYSVTKGQRSRRVKKGEMGKRGELEVKAERNTKG